ncbi:tetratricopeptide repeat protein [Candidatus Poribacteria bacterium]|nr:tetratricopeptide repeat protein [Candidatus Poribacteria bacterium]
MNTSSNSFFYKTIFIFSFLLIAISESFAFKRVNEKDIAPEILLEDTEGNKIKLSDFKGNKTVSLVFWKNPSLRGEKALILYQKLFDAYRNEFPFQVLAIYVPENDDRIPEDEIKTVKQIMVNNKITYPVLIDKGMEIFSRYGVITFPSSAIVDKEGIMIYELPGLSEFFGEKDIITNVKKALNIKEEEKIIAKEKYLAKNNSNYFLNLARQVHIKGNTPKAIEHTLTAIERDPAFPDEHAYLGFLYSQVKNYNKAIEAYLKSLQLDASNSETLLAYGFLCLDAGMKEDAYLQFKNIIKNNTEKSAEGYYGLGSIYLQDENYDTAIVNQQKAIELYGSWKDFTQDERIHYAQAYYVLGETYLKTNQKDKAAQNFQKSFSVYKELTTKMLKGKESMLNYRTLK